MRQVDPGSREPGFPVDTGSELGYADHMNGKEIVYAPVRVGRTLFRKLRDKMKDDVELPPRLKVAHGAVGVLIGLAIVNVPMLFVSITLGNYWTLVTNLFVIVTAPIAYIVTEERTKEYLEQHRD